MHRRRVNLKLPLISSFFKEFSMPKGKSQTKTIATSNIVSDVAARFTELPKKLTKEVITCFLEAVESSVSGGHKVRIDRVGILTVKDRAARKGRNPQTGEEIRIPASKKISFRVAKSLKEKVGIQKKRVVKKK